MIPSSACPGLCYWSAVKQEEFLPQVTQLCGGTAMGYVVPHGRYMAHMATTSKQLGVVLYPNCDHCNYPHLQLLSPRVAVIEFAFKWWSPHVFWSCFAVWLAQWPPSALPKISVHMLQMLWLGCGPFPLFPAVPVQRGYPWYLVVTSPSCVGSTSWWSKLLIVLVYV